MRYLTLPELELLNALLTNIDCEDGSRIAGRIEAFSCKAAGSDKKLWKHLGTRFPNDSQMKLSKYSDSLELLNSEDSMSTFNNTSVSGNISTKLLYYLISTMNQLFPDYDFSNLPSATFRPQTVSFASSQINASLFNTGLNKNVESFNDFTCRMWDRIDEAINLEECDVYSFINEEFDALEDPFWERGCIWSLNYFFWNKKLKRMLVYTLKAVNDLMRDSDSFIADDRFSQRSPTPAGSTM